MQLTLIRGLPGSGKSTLAKKLASTDDGEHFEADMYFIDFHTRGYKFDASKLAAAHAWCWNSTFREVSFGGSVYVSNTFTTIRELKPYFDIALELGITPTVITMNNQWGNVHGVPDDTLEAMKQRFVHDLSPLFDEHAKNLRDKYRQTV